MSLIRRSLERRGADPTPRELTARDVLHAFDIPPHMVGQQRPTQQEVSDE